MDKKKLLLIGGGAILLIAIFLIISLISQKGQPTTGNSGIITGIVVAKSEDQTKSPIGVTDLFSVADSEIHAIVSFNNLPIKQNITYQWVDLKKNEIIKEEKRQNKDVFSGLSSSILIKNDRFSWGPGDYEVRVLVNDQLIIKKDYFVRTDIDIEQNKVLSSIQSVDLTTSVDLGGKPTGNISSKFSKDDENIFASVSYTNMPVKSEFDARWIYISTEQLIKRYQKTIIGTDTFAFGINAKADSWVPIKKWPVGKYELRIYLNGDQIRIIPFTVE